MIFESQVVVKGMKRSKGDFEGTAFDYTAIFIEVSLDESKKNAIGTATQDFRMGTSEVYDRFASIPFPFNAKAKFEMVASGKGTVQRLLDLVPVPLAARPA
jgi:hypothetical protein